ncbi:MAG: hypothetical protein KJ077_15790 [Anaerolineae bacterium]|nr:hypothetical protein [Anaerolineae bacterium]
MKVIYSESLMETFLVVLVGILITATLVAFDEASALKKVINCVIGGIILGVIIMTPVGVIIGIIAPGTVSSIWKDILFAGIFGGILGVILGAGSGLIVFVLSVLIRLVKALYYWQ